VSGQIQWEIEWADKRTGPDRHPLKLPAVSFGPWADLHGQDLSQEAHRFLGCDPESVDEAGYLASGVANRLSGFDAEAFSQLIESFPESADAMIEDRLTRVGR